MNSEPTSRSSVPHALGPAWRGTFAGALFIAVMSPGLAARLVGDADGVFLLSWLTPFAVAAALWPIHRPLSSFVLRAALHVSALAFLLRMGLIGIMMRWPGAAQTGGEAMMAVQALELGLLFHVCALLMCLPNLIIDWRSRGLFSRHPSDNPQA